MEPKFRNIYEELDAWFDGFKEVCSFKYQRFKRDMKAWWIELKFRITR